MAILRELSLISFCRLFRMALNWIPGFAYLVRLRMNIRMMIMGRKMATDGDPVNDAMTQQAIDFMESQIVDPELRETLRPKSKCKLPGGQGSYSVFRDS
jgi:hypothetical protein